MINKITMTNFQSHKKTVIDLSDKLNFFIGDTDSGKSAIIRALDFVMNNNAKDEHVSNSIKRTEKGNKPKDNAIVRIDTDKGYVERVKGKDNYYEINGEKLTAFNRSVPDEVMEFFNITDLNIQTQRNNFFLLAETNGEVARSLNKTVNLENIDSSLLNVKRKLKSIKDKKEAKDNEQEELREKLKAFEGLEDIASKVSYLQTIETNLNNTEDTLNDITALYEVAVEIKEKLNNIDIKQEEKIETLLILNNELESIEKEYTFLFDLIEQYKEIKETLDRYKGLETASKIIERGIVLSNELNEIWERYESLKGYKEEYDTIKNELNTVSSIDENSDTIYKLLNVSDELKTIENEKEVLWKLVEEYNSISKLIKFNYRERRMKEREYEKIKPDECPLCGGEM